MAEYDVAFPFAQHEICFRIAQRCKRMAETMKAVAPVLLMPVIQKVIMQEGATHQLTPVPVQMQPLRQAQAVICHANAVVIHRGTPMLCEIAGNLKPPDHRQFLCKFCNQTLSVCRRHRIPPPCFLSCQIPKALFLQIYHKLPGWPSQNHCS